MYGLEIAWQHVFGDLGFGQSHNGASFGIEPTYVNTAWAINMSTSYDVTDNINAYFEVDNVLNQAFSTRGRYPDQVLDVVACGRRFTAGIHF